MSVFWTVIVKTGNVDSAGTDARVYIMLKGKDGAWTESFELNNYEDNFERNKTDTFIDTSLRDVGELEELKVWHDNSGNKPGWFLDEIQMVNTSCGKGGFYRFPCHQWLSVSDGDHQIERVLHPQATGRLLKRA